MRVNRKYQFDTTKRLGRRLSHGAITANWAPSPEGSPLQCGIVTSRKLGPAVVRNRARRLLRECFRLHQHDFFRPTILILVARSSIVGKRFIDVERDFLALMNQAKLFKKTAE